MMIEAAPDQKLPEVSIPSLVSMADNGEWAEIDQVLSNETRTAEYVGWANGNQDSPVDKYRLLAQKIQAATKPGEN